MGALKVALFACTLFALSSLASCKTEKDVTKLQIGVKVRHRLSTKKQLLVWYKNVC